LRSATEPGCLPLDEVLKLQISLPHGGSQPLKPAFAQLPHAFRRDSEVNSESCQSSRWVLELRRYYDLALTVGQSANHLDKKSAQRLDIVAVHSVCIFHADWIDEPRYPVLSVITDRWYVQREVSAGVSVRCPRSDGEMECLLDVHHRKWTS